MQEIEAIRLSCPFCDKRLRVAAKLAGKRVRCPGKACARSFAVPIPTVSTPMPAVPAPTNCRACGSALFEEAVESMLLEGAVFCMDCGFLIQGDTATTVPKGSPNSFTNPASGTANPLRERSCVGSDNLLPIDGNRGVPSVAQNLIQALQTVEERLHAVGENDQSKLFAELRASFEDTDLRVVIFGEFNRGKSTLINALLGRCVLPAKLIPTTGHVTRLVHGLREKVCIGMLDGSTQTCSLEQLDSFSSLNRDGLARDDIELIEVFVNCPLLDGGLVLVDTPGVNEKDAQTQRAVHAIAKADLVLMVLDARQLLGSSERTLAMDWLSKELGKPVVLIVNFMNFLADADQADVRRRLEVWCKGELRSGLGRSWYEANVLAALKHGLGSGPPPSDHFHALRSALAKCTGATRRDLQGRSRRGQLSAEVGKVRQQNHYVLKRIRDDAAQIERERAVQRHDLQEIGRRFETDASAQRDRLCMIGQHTLEQNLEALVSWRFAGESKENLEANASGWYQGKLDEAVRAIEKEGDGAMLSLVGENLRRPEPFTIRERMILNVRLEVGELSKASATGKTIGAVIGGIFGMPEAGTLVGASVGAWLGNLLGQKQPDYVAAYCQQARVRWFDDTRDVLAVLQGQYDARVQLLKRQLENRLEAVKTQPLSIEFRERECLETALSVCERELKSL